jgi:hypothetical protein
MAAGAAHGDAHHGGANCLHDFINPVSARLPDGGWFASDGGGWDVRASNQKPGRFADAELISGELFGDELIVRGVVVEGAESRSRGKTRHFSGRGWIRSRLFRPSG